MKKISRNIKDTESIAKNFLGDLKVSKTGATVVGLYGDLGVGKTQFTKIIADMLGVKGKVASPTFIIMKNYQLKGGVHKKFFHLDAYRLKNEKELEILGWDEIVNDKDNLVFIEWPENVKKIMPKHRKIKISHKNNDEREFEIE